MEGVKIIGYVTKPELGSALITRDGGEIALKAQGRPGILWLKNRSKDIDPDKA